MPFITETIWQALPRAEGPSVMVSKWPEYDEAELLRRRSADGSLMDAVRAIRNRRAEMNVPPSKKAKVLILTEKKGHLLRRRRLLPRSWHTLRD